MKRAFLLLFTFLCLAAAASRSQAQTATTFDCDRYTDTGGGNVRFEQGTLFADGSYIPATSDTFPASQFQLDAATLAQVSGQPVATLNLYQQLANISPNYLSNFPRSTATYSINGVPYVTVHASGAVLPPPPGVAPATTFDCDRYTDAGGGNVRFEQGTLYLDGSYIPTTSNIFPASQFQLDAATLRQVSGQPVATLNLYQQDDELATGYLSNFPRSSATYSINGVPYVILRATGATATVPRVSVAVLVPQVAVGGGAFGEFLLSRSGAPAADLVVNYTLKGTAVNGVDYVMLKGTAKIKAGATSKPVKVRPLGDLGGAAKKTVKLSLAPGSGYTVGTVAPAKVKIVP